MVQKVQQGTATAPRCAIMLMFSVLLCMAADTHAIASMSGCIKFRGLIPRMKLPVLQSLALWLLFMIAGITSFTSATYMYSYTVHTIYARWS
jgi:hypothetical protein